MEAYWPSKSSGRTPATRSGSSSATLPPTTIGFRAGQVPVNLFTNDRNFAELGPGTLLPDGRVFYIGATSNTAIYTPPTPGKPDRYLGRWADDSRRSRWQRRGRAVLTNGRVLFAAADARLLGGGTRFFEYDPVTNTINPVNNLPTTSAAFEIHELEPVQCDDCRFPAVRSW